MCVRVPLTTHICRPCPSVGLSRLLHTLQTRRTLSYTVPALLHTSIAAAAVILFVFTAFARPSPSFFFYPFSLSALAPIRAPAATSIRSPVYLAALSSLVPSFLTPRRRIDVCLLISVRPTHTRVYCSRRPRNPASSGGREGAGEMLSCGRAGGTPAPTTTRCRAHRFSDEKKPPCLFFFPLLFSRLNNFRKNVRYGKSYRSTTSKRILFGIFRIRF